MTRKPKVFEYYTSLAHAITNNEISRYQDKIKHCTERNAELSKALNEATTNFMLTGIAQVPADLKSWSGWLQEGSRTYFYWKKYFRKLATDLARPFVYYTEGYNYSYNEEPKTLRYVEIKVPMRKYTAPLVSQFLLVGKKNEGQRYEGPILYWNNTREWSFYFHKEGIQLAQAWLASCATDPDKRRALRLTR